MTGGNLESKLSGKAFQQSPRCYGIVRDVGHSSKRAALQSTHQQGRQRGQGEDEAVSLGGSFST